MTSNPYRTAGERGWRGQSCVPAESQLEHRLCTLEKAMTNDAVKPGSMDEALKIARTINATEFGDAGHVLLARQLLAAHEENEKLRSALKEALDIAQYEAEEYQGKREHLDRIAALRKEFEL